MQSIILTEEHKSKLLEMCKVLFPKDKVDYIEKGVIYFLINYFERFDPNNSKVTFGGWDKTESIHWFEFCVNILSKKLYLKLDKRKHTHFLFNNTKGIVVYHEHSIFTNYYLYFEKECHLIDYLYEIFKQLK